MITWWQGFISGVVVLWMVIPWLRYMRRKISKQRLCSRCEGSGYVSTFGGPERGQ